MTGNEELLYDVKEGRGKMIIFDNNEIIYISKVGKLTFFYSLDHLASKFPISDAYFIPSIHKSLLSISQLDK